MYLSKDWLPKWHEVNMPYTQKFIKKYKMKKYVLLKDLPDGAKAGDIYELHANGEFYINEREQDKKSTLASIRKNTYATQCVENNTEWFQLVEESRNSAEALDYLKSNLCKLPKDILNAISHYIDYAEKRKWTYEDMRECFQAGESAHYIGTKFEKYIDSKLKNK